MAKPKAPRWLTQAFADGVDERDGAGAQPWAYGECLEPWCWLAEFDPMRRPCSGPVERFHFIPRQRVENALGAMLLGSRDETGWVSTLPSWRQEIVLLAAWDPRNGGLGCEHHHRRFDGHATSPRAPKIVVPFPRLPEHAYDYVDDFGFRGAGWLTERFPA